MTLADAVTALTDVGVGGVIALGATIWIAGILYARFRR